MPKSLMKTAKRSQNVAHTATDNAEKKQATQKPAELSPEERKNQQDKVDAIKKKCPYPNVKGCWLCNKDDHILRFCPMKSEFFNNGAGKGLQK